MPFGIWNQVRPRNQALDGVRLPRRERAILRRKGAGQHIYRTYIATVHGKLVANGKASYK